MSVDYGIYTTKGKRMLEASTTAPFLFIGAEI